VKLNNALLGYLLIGMMTSLAFAERGTTKIAGTKAGSMVSGTVKLEDMKEGLKISADLMGVPPGQHAFHIHEFGSCEDEGKAAGSHYNPSGHPHGDAIKMGIKKTHAGDFGNITIGDDGKGIFQAVVGGLTLSHGKYSVAGRAFILHEKPDDFSQPVGNAGSRIGCGPILITKE